MKELLSARLEAYNFSRGLLQNKSKLILGRVGGVGGRVGGKLGFHCKPRPNKLLTLGYFGAP